MLQEIIINISFIYLLNKMLQEIIINISLIIILYKFV